MAEKRYFVMNPAGAIHECTLEHGRERLKQPGWRRPTKAQIQQYLKVTEQRWNKPIGERWNPEPDAVDVEVEGVEA